MMKKRLRANSRLDTIVGLINEHGFLSVNDLSHLCQVSEITIRRDLIALDQQKRIQRTHGGGASLRGKKASLTTSFDTTNNNGLERPLLDRIDALIATVVDIRRDKPVLDQFIRGNIPIVAEALPALNEITVVTVDNYTAGLELGRWIGRYVTEHWNQPVHVLDLTYHLPNTAARSRGFMSGLRQVIPDADEMVSLNTESRYDLAYQLTRDALSARSNINLIFAINDTNASAAIQACRDLRVDPAQVKVIPFGLEGDTLRNELSTCPYCLAGLAMFPEIVGPVCIEAAIEAYNRRPLPPQLLTPYAILTPETLPEFYTRTDTGWIPHWRNIKDRAALPIEIDRPERHASDRLPQRIGFTVRFSEHEWYQNLIAAMQAQVAQLGIELEIIDIDQTIKDEIDLRQREIARRAFEEIKPGDVVVIDNGPIGVHLAELLANYEGVTVISNSMPVLEVLKTNPNIIVIATGGAIRHSSQALVGPTAEATLREMRADKLFLNVSGVSLSFGLSHPNISEVTIKQTMIRSAREVILLTDHTCFGHESFIHVAPLKSIHKLITDDALPASFRLELSKLGIEVVLAGM